MFDFDRDLNATMRSRHRTGTARGRGESPSLLKCRCNRPQFADRAPHHVLDRRSQHGLDGARLRGIEHAEPDQQRPHGDVGGAAGAVVDLERDPEPMLRQRRAGHSLGARLEQP